MIKIEGARVHNLKNVDVDIPRNSLTVITGLSGSGKSSLAFDTIFAEGQRRYIETFSAYIRNFLGGMERPDVDKISGLSPVISIEQKTTNKNPRSTVGTVTEVYDYLRLLYARAGTAYSYETGEKMVKYTEEDVMRLLLEHYDGKRIFLLAPLVQSRKGHYRELFESIRKKGYLYARVDGEIVEVTEGMKVDRYKNHDIEVVIDKLAISAKDDERLKKSLEVAMKMGEGQVMVVEKETNVLKHYSKRLMCPTTGLCYRDPAPNNFSFNSPQGACPHCKGLGVVPAVDIESVDYQGMAEYVQSLNMEEQREWTRKWEESVDKLVVCPECEGKRLNKEALHFRIDGKNISEVSDMELSDLYEWVTTVEPKLESKQQAIAHEIIKEISSRLKFLLDVGLHYLSLSRNSGSLSGGESQRIRLATQIGAKLVNVLYILDEPSIGLHQRDNVQLINSLKELRDEGNTVIVVEHDKDMMLSADYVVDMGPRAGRLGGEVVFQGTPKAMLKQDTLTSRFLNGTEKIEVPAERRKGNGKSLQIVGAKGNNLKNVSVEIPLGMLVCVTGVSGSGKSTLINETLQPFLSQHFYRSQTEPLAVDAITGIEHIDKIVSVDQSPIGRTPRSNPATYTDVFTDIRKLFVEMPESKMRAYKPGRFSFNVAGGRCEVCGGNGYKTIQMNFLPDVLVPCEVCHGKRYNRETLEVRFKGKSISDVLNMTINQAVEFFEHQPKILQKIKVLQDVGLGYIKLGQPSSTLSGGESQRVKLATELAKKDTGKTLYILDEPTTGLHFEDIRTLMVVLNRLVDKGNTVIVIEHNLDVIKLADHIIDMGPEGGQQGGTVVVTGTPEEVALSGKGITSSFLKQELGL
ncbi:MAG: excinuclease ABC subunit UvrA [Bacteroidaceae bacterium]|nr:excinuclease ABC subunit UvrA [Bacteroidaceae bacterium]MBR1521991.1 excinuclease ABC subunit UvrA [Bacteroidaceae bacterium]